MLDNKFKKQIGFIKSHSSTKNLRENIRNDSSDSFSSFQYQPHHREQQFSPYRHPVQKIVNKKPTQATKTKKAKQQVRSKKVESKHPKFSNQMLRNNFLDSGTQMYKVTKNTYFQHESINNELEDINNQIKQVRNRFKESRREYQEEQDEEIQTPKLPDRPNLPSKEQEELSLSNINKVKKNQMDYSSSPLPLEEQQKYPKTMDQYRKYMDQPSEEDSDELRFKKTFKRTDKNERKQYQEQLIPEYDKRQFKEKNIKKAILQHQYQNPKPDRHNKKGLVQSKGGVCFEVDTRQFKVSQEKIIREKRNKKRKALAHPMSTKEQLLIRRQTAKRYDRESRVKLFGY